MAISLHAATDAADVHHDGDLAEAVVLCEQHADVLWALTCASEDDNAATQDGRCGAID